MRPTARAGARRPRHEDTFEAGPVNVTQCNPMQCNVLSLSTMRERKVDSLKVLQLDVFLRMDTCSAVATHFR
jgi:hypothetical protein